MKNVLVTLLASFALTAVAGTAGAVTPSAPHDSSNGYSCATCHALQKTLGSTGYNNICLSCHQPGDPRGGVKPFTPADAADPFGTYTANLPATRYQTSHRWDGPDTNLLAGAQPPIQAALTTSGLRSRTGNQLACVRCHDQHSQTNRPFLRVVNDRDQLCLDCHRSRDQRSHTAGTHPVNVAYSNITSKFYPTPVNANPANPSSAMRLNAGNILCSTCHRVHYSDSNSATYDSYSSFAGLTPSDGSLLRTDLRGATANGVNICTNCHKGKSAHDKNGQNVQCTDCHGAHVDLGDGTKPNSNLVKRQMTFSSALRSARHIQAGFSSATVKTYAAAGNGVCEVCHSIPMTAGFQTFHGPATSNPLFGGISTGTCNQCHEHGNPLGSFAVDPTKACNACHGYPPTSNTVGAGGFAAGYVGTDESLSGHTSHASTPYQKACNECHSGNNHLDGIYQDVFLARGPVAVATGTTPTYDRATQTCSNVYCHSNASPRGGTPAFATPPPWSSERGGGKGAIIGQAGECGFCHSRAGDVAPTWSVSHTRHVNGYSANAIFTCAACHAATASGSSTLINTPAARELHTNGVKNVTFGAIAVSGSWDATAATCSNVYCHSTVQGAGGLGAATFATPTWNSAAMSCGSCHAAMTVLNAVTSASGSHKRHVQGYSFGCDVCHGVGYSSSTVVVATHVDNTINLSFTGQAAINGAAPTYYQGSNAPGTGYDKCNNVYCHSTVQANGGAGAPASFLSPTWGSGPLACGSCHVHMAISAAATGSHQLHAATAGYACSTCHSGAGKDPVTGAITAKHANGSIDIAFSGSGTGTSYSRGAAHAPGSGAYGSCSTSTCHGSGTPVWGANTTRPECEKCHGSAATSPFTTTAGASVNTDPKAGAHTAHLQASHSLTGTVACAECHAVPAAVTSTGHMNGTAEVPLTGTLARTGNLTPTYTPATGSCSATYCHGAAMPGGDTTGSTTSPTWNAAILPATVSAAACGTCHGFPPSTASGHPAVSTPVPGTWGNGSTAIGTSCNCHNNINSAGTSYATIFVNGAQHINGTLEIPSGGHAVPYPGAQHLSPAGTTPWAGCSGCHDTTATGQSYPAVASGVAPNCTACHLQGLKVPSGTSSCWDCHGSAAVDGRPNGATYPNTAGSHAAHIYFCNVCHNGAGSGSNSHGPGRDPNNPQIRTTHSAPISFLAATAGASAAYAAATKSCSSLDCHGNATWGGSLGCVQCHAAVVSSPVAASLDAAVTTRPNVVASFSLASRHNRSRGTAVTNNDCCVCHMEGDVATGATNATYHRNGFIELRDPDTGLTIKGVAHSGTTAAPGAYTSTGTDARPVRFSRNLGSATIEADTAAIMVNHCLKCHDANGATSTTAQVPGGSAGKPFAGTVGANPSGNVLDVAAQFASTNRSFHPVLVRQNSGYTNTGGSRMVAPWSGVTKSATTTVYGPLISCWDCHAPNNTASTVTLATSGIHGGAVNSSDSVPLRGNVYVNGTTAATNLCLYCHVVSGGTTNHGAGSAITSSTNGSMTYFQNRCYFCHGSYGSRASVVRPMGAGDAHGFNTRATGAAFPAANNGYAFLRNEGWYANGYTQSIQSIGATTYTPTCGGMGAGGGCSRSSMGGYTPGGVY